MEIASSYPPYLAKTSPQSMGIKVDRAEGSWIHDTAGKGYLDMISGIAVTNVGHRHPKVIAAIEAQLAKYLHVMPFGEFVQEPQRQLSDKLQALLPNGLDVSYFVNSGAEANEAALKLAKRYTGRSKIVSCLRSYHGSTHGALSVSGNEKKKYAFRPLLPEVYFMEFNKIEDLSVIDEQTAAVIIEPIQGDAGVRIPDRAYMVALRERCTETGAQLIFDEIQTGFGRTGRWFAFEHYGVVPDILTIAKSMAGGMAMGAFISCTGRMRTLSRDPILGHITTFGGHPVCCAAAIGNIEAIESEGMIAGVEAKGAYLEIKLQHPRIKEIRRKGLMFAVEFESPEEVAAIVSKCMELGVITFYFLSCPESFRLAPPLNVSYDDLDFAAEIIQKAISELG